MNTLRWAGLAGLLCLSLVACNSGGDGQMGQGGAGNPVTLEFRRPNQRISEDDGPATIALSLSRVLSTDVTATIAISGSALEGADFTIDPGPIVIPAGDQKGFLTLTPILDSACEDSETAVLTLVSVQGAELGGTVVHSVGLEDVATEVVFEAELNDGVATANPVGAILPERCLEIRGMIQEGFPDPFDVFEFTTGARAAVSVELRPASSQADVLLFVTDGAGALILPPVQGAGAGGLESVSFEIDSGVAPEFNLSISSFGPPTSYELRISSAIAPPSPSRTLEDPWAVDWAQLKESLNPRRHGSPRARALTPVGLGLSFDLSSGSVQPGVLLSDR